ncbi:MAG: hypothetical protein KAX69_04405, partial [Chitinophagales bacterium]|nr:hypothetical protein [Chitinophagales bacterium]
NESLYKRYFGWIPAWELKPNQIATLQPLDINAGSSIETFKTPFNSYILLNLSIIWFDNCPLWATNKFDNAL